jgi:hypothetical protein
LIQQAECDVSRRVLVLVRSEQRHGRWVTAEYVQTARQRLRRGWSADFTASG